MIIDDYSSFSVRRDLTLAHQIRPGSIWINTYKTICDQALFDGFKESGQEKELGRYGLEAYYQVKTIVVKLVWGKTIQIFHEEQLFGFACLTF